MNLLSEEYDISQCDGSCNGYLTNSCDDLYQINIYSTGIIG